MKAYLITSAEKKVEQIDFVGDYKKIGELVGSPFDVIMLPEEDACYIDDEGLLKPQAFFFKLGLNHMLAGNGLVLGTDEDGDSTDVKIPLEDFRKEVQFFTAEELGLDPKVAPYDQPSTHWQPSTMTTVEDGRIVTTVLGGYGSTPGEVIADKPGSFADLLNRGEAR